MFFGLVIVGEEREGEREIAKEKTLMLRSVTVVVLPLFITQYYLHRVEG